MASYIVLEPTDAAICKHKSACGDHTVFVRDEFSVLALILPFLWLVIHRLWWHALMIAVIGWGAFSMLGTYLSSPYAVAILSFLLSLFVALEGRNWYLAALRYKGYKEVAQINATDLWDAETVYFYGAARFAEHSEPERHLEGTAAVKTDTMPNGAPATGTMIGLVEYRGRV
ncbi:DUF2628 domain-containing protein [Pseudochrobactrum sp. MP213Fo]|uniref:DUF2628 domain-containing protein n=1 Tax=Pseudochrobactrum sp. MP213Fo TaxID=3022250 RepID=UPI003BA394B4